MANIGLGQIIASAPLIDRIQSVHQGQAGAANPQNAEALQKRQALQEKAVQQLEGSDPIQVRREKEKEQGKGRQQPSEQEELDEDGQPRRRIDVRA